MSSDIGVPFTDNLDRINEVKSTVMAVDYAIFLGAFIVSIPIFFATCCCWIPCLSMKKKFEPLQNKQSKVDRFYDFFLFAMKWFFADSKDYFFPMKALPYLQFLGILQYFDSKRKRILKNQADEEERLANEEDSDDSSSDEDNHPKKAAKKPIKSDKETHFPWYMSCFKEIEFGPILSPFHKLLTVILFAFRCALLVYCFYWDGWVFSQTSTTQEFFNSYMYLTYISFDMIILYLIVVVVYSGGYLLNKVTIFASKKLGEDQSKWIQPTTSYVAQFCGFFVQIIGECTYILACLVSIIYWVFLVDYQKLDKLTWNSICRHTTFILLIFDFLLSDFRFHWSHFPFVVTFVYGYLSLVTSFFAGGVLRRYPYKLLSYYETQSAVFYHALAFPILLVFFALFWFVSVIKTLFFHAKRPLVLYNDARIMGASPAEYEKELKQKEADTVSDEEEDAKKEKEHAAAKKAEEEKKKKEGIKEETEF